MFSSAQFNSLFIVLYNCLAVALRNEEKSFPHDAHDCGSLGPISDHHNTTPAGRGLDERTAGLHLYAQSRYRSVIGM